MGCVSFQIPCDDVLKCVGGCFFRQCNYVCNLKKSLTTLGTAMELLSAKRDDVLQRVQREERNGRRKLRVVQVWLNKVETIENEFKELHTACLVELKRLCLCGFFPKKFKSTYSYGRSVFKMLPKVELYRSEDLTVVTAPHINVVVRRLVQPAILGGEAMLQRAWDHLMDDGTVTMGLYGMGGVGKTTLLEQINNKFLDKNDGFDRVIWIVVSKDKHDEKIQDEIADRLGLNGGEWDRKTRSQKSIDIQNSMIDMRFVLLLDDIWRKVDLVKEIGVPSPTKENKCKIVFTTRSRDVCGRMGVDDPMEVNCLGSNDALDLFRNKVGKTH